MRRLLFLALFLALIGGMAFSQVTFTGLWDYGVYSDFQRSPEQYAYGKLQFNDQLDQFNTLVFRFRWKNTNFGQFDGSVLNWTSIDRFYLSTDVTGALGVTDSPVTMKLGFGFQDPNGADLTGGISPFEVADLSGNDIGGDSQPTIYPVITINKMVNIGAIIAPGVFNKDADQNGQGYEIFVNGGQGPVMAEVGYGNVYKGQTYPGSPSGPAAAPFTRGFYANWADPATAATATSAPPLNFMWAAANYKGSAADLDYAVAVNGQYSLDSDSQGFLLRNHYAAYQDLPTTWPAKSLDAVTYGYGVAASVVYQKMYTLKAGLVGIEGSMLNRAELYAIAMLNPMVAIDGGMVLNLDSDYTGSTGADMVNDADVGIIVYLGKANFRIGYLYLDKNAIYSVMADDIGRIGDTNGPSSPSSGLFISSVFSF